jgi:UPF0755 protein
MRRVKYKITLTVVVCLSLLAGAGLWVNAYLSEPLRLSGDAYRLDVIKGSSLRSVALALADDGLLRHPGIFALIGRISGKAERIQAGEYALTPVTTPASLLDQMVDGRVKLYSLTVVEGWTVSDLLDTLRRHPALEQTLDIEAPIDLVDLLDLNYAHPEGVFFPDTYKFPRGTTDAELLRRAYDLMQTHLARAWENRQPDLILTNPYEALIMASIVERESALESERPEIAGVFLRRLEKNMRLQTDPTVIYGLGSSFDGNLTRDHLKTDGPYNTYKRRGLPPTPIALPSESALAAAVNPSAGDSLYFVATGHSDGSHYFTATLDEHNAAVARYLAYMRQEKGR